MICKIDVELIGQLGESYPGYLIKYKGPGVFVFKFIGDDGEFDVTAAQIRLPPNGFQHTFNGCEVRVGDNVDVLNGKPYHVASTDSVLLESGDQPRSWWPARVVKTRGELVVVEYTELFAACAASNATVPSLETGLELTQIRPRSSRTVLTNEDFYYSLLQIPKELIDLFLQPNFIEHITRFCSPSMLICEVDDKTILPPSIHMEGSCESECVNFISVFTSEASKLKAEIIFTEIPKMLRQKFAIINQINQLTTRIKENNVEKKSDLFYHDFTVDQQLLGYSIGVKGSNICRARSVDGIVSVILEPKTGLFKICGKTPEAIDNAKKLLDYVTDTVVVPKVYVSRVIGSKNHQIQYIVDRSGLARIRIGKTSGSSNDALFTLTGTRSSINGAKLLINFLVDNLKDIDDLKSQLPSRNGPGDFDRNKKRNNSQSDNYRSDLKPRGAFVNGEYISDSGVGTSTSPAGELNGHHTDGALDSRPISRPGRTLVRASVNGSIRSSGASKQRSLPPKPVPKTSESPQTMNASKQKKRRAKASKHNQTNNIETVPVADVKS